MIVALVKIFWLFLAKNSSWTIGIVWMQNRTEDISASFSISESKTTHPQAFWSTSKQELHLQGVRCWRGGRTTPCKFFMGFSTPSEAPLSTMRPLWKNWRTQWSPGQPPISLWSLAGRLLLRWNVLLQRMQPSHPIPARNFSTRSQFGRELAALIIAPLRTQAGKVKWHFSLQFYFLSLQLLFQWLCQPARARPWN